MFKLISNIFSLMAGNAGAQLIALAAMPLLGRLYSPETFGLFGALFALINMLSILFSLRMELTIVEAKADEKRLAELATYLFVCITAGVLSPIIIAGIIYFYDVSIMYAALCMLAAVGSSLVQVAIARGIATAQYKLLSIVNILRATFLAVVQLFLFYVFSDSPLPLIIGLIVSLMVHYIVFINVSDSAPKEIYPSIGALLRFIRENNSTPRYAGTQALVNSLSQSIPYFILPIFFPVAVTGLYYFADKVFRLPLTLIGQPIRQVFLGYCSSENSDMQKLRIIFYLLSFGCFVFSICVSALLFAFGSDIFHWIFGAAYADAGVIAAWLGIWGVGAFVSFPSLSLLRSFNKNEFILKMEVFWAFLKAGSLLVSGYFYNDMSFTVKIFSIVSALYGITMFYKASILLGSPKSLLS